MLPGNIIPENCSLSKIQRLSTVGLANYGGSGFIGDLREETAVPPQLSLVRELVEIT